MCVLVLLVQFLYGIYSIAVISLAEWVHWLLLHKLFGNQSTGCFTFVVFWLLHRCYMHRPLNLPGGAVVGHARIQKVLREGSNSDEFFFMY